MLSLQEQDRRAPKGRGGVALDGHTASAVSKVAGQEKRVSAVPLILRQGRAAVANFELPNATSVSNEPIRGDNMVKNYAEICGR